MRPGINTYQYNADGMLTASSGAQYVYDALNQRVEKTVGSVATEYVYFQGRVLAELNPGSTPPWTDMIYAGGAMIAEVKGSQTATPEYRLLDHLGSLAMTTDNSGNVTGANVFLPFGQLMSSTTNDAVQFTGLEQDTENSSDHAWFRNYSTEQNRWLRPDPYNGSYDITNPQSFNRYSYVLNNPLAFTDPSWLHIVGYCKPGCSGVWGSGNPNGGTGDEFQLIFIEWGGEPEFSPYTGNDGMYYISGTPLNGVWLPAGSVFLTSIYSPSFAAGNGLCGAPNNGTVKCSGSARVLQGNAATIGSPGGFSGPSVGNFPVTANGAAVIPSQWGPSKAFLRPYLNQISGVFPSVNYSFTGIVDVMGGAPPPGFPANSNVQTDLMQLNPGDLILELPGAPRDFGTTGVTITAPSAVGCPAGTVQVP